VTPLLLHTGELTRYHFGAGHPMSPHRVSLAVQLARFLGLTDLFDVIEPPPARDDLLLRVHTPGYLAALRSGRAHPEHGIGTPDQPLAPDLPPVASRIVAASVAAAEAVWEGRTSRAVNLAGGLHHAARDRMSGFCMFNDAAVAIDRLLELGAQRVVYLDLDAHHGDGVEKLYWDDPRVLTISIHESGLYLFPGTGHAGDIGGPGALGTAVNIALDRRTGDREWLRAVHGIVPPLLQAFSPEIIVSQHGTDAHRADPLTDLELSVDVMGLVYRTVGAWARRYAQGRWVALGGGGYHVDSVARAWVLLLAAVADVSIDATVRMPRAGDLLTSPTLGDPGAEERLRDYRPGMVLSERPAAALRATSRAVFPYWGLQPY